MTDASSSTNPPTVYATALSAETATRDINWRNAGFLLALHLMALLAFLPWLFSWTGLILFIIGNYVFATLGINIGYHRLLTHRGFNCPKWLEYTLLILGCCSGQDSPTNWGAMHRRHHQYPDEEHDLHSPLRGFFWAHIGWLIFKCPDLNRHLLMDRYAKDLRRDPFHAWLVRHDMWMVIAIASYLMFFVGGIVAAALMGQGGLEALQFGLSLFIWGAVVRTVFTLHVTWLVNSAAHLWGYRNYETNDNSRNNVLVGILASGEGWHNNHHADPRSARHGHKWWEFDLSWLTIRLLMLCGLATDVALPSPVLAAKLNGASPQPADEFDSFERNEVRLVPHK